MANGIAVNDLSFYGMYYVVINPKSVCMYPMTLFDGGSPEGPFQPKPNSEFFSVNGITNIEEIRMRLNISSYSLLEGMMETVLNETVVVNP